MRATSSPQESCVEIPLAEYNQLLLSLCVGIYRLVRDAEVAFDLEGLRENRVEHLERRDLRIDAELSPLLRSSFLIFLRE